MIEIIKHGKKKYKYTCPSCGCVFTTDGEEIIRERSIDGKWTIKCPECDTVIDATPKRESLNEANTSSIEEAYKRFNELRKVYSSER